jgi:hypothetical protein
MQQVASCCDAPMASSIPNLPVGAEGASLDFDAVVKIVVQPEAGCPAGLACTTIFTTRRFGCQRAKDVDQGVPGVSAQPGHGARLAFSHALRLT